MSEQFNNFVGGCLKDKFDRRDYYLAGVQAPVDLPYEFYLDDNFPIKKQYNRPSCTAQSQATHKEKQERISLSARYIMAKTKELEGNTDWGAYCRDTFKVVHDFGAPAEESYPEPDGALGWLEYIYPNTSSVLSEEAARHKSGSYWRIESNVEAIKQAIFQNKQSVVIAIPWFNSYNRPNPDGTLPQPDTNSQGHAVEAVGFKRNMLYIRNSFGKNWGDNGHFLYEDSPQRKIWDAWQSCDEKKPFPVEYRYYDPKYWKEENPKWRPWHKYLQEIAFVAYWTSKLKRLPSPFEINASVYGFWPKEAIFMAKYGDKWLWKTYPDYLKETGLKIIK